MTAAFLRLVTFILRGTETQPTGEVLLRGETTDVDTDFRQNHQGRSHVDPRDQGQVHAQGLEQRGRRVEPDVIAFSSRLAWLGGPSLFSRLVRQALQFRLNLVVALR